MIQDSLTERIIGAAMAVHAALGPGFLESVYQKALLIELKERGINAQSQKAIPVFYKGNNVGDFVVDIDADGVLLELKATHEHHEMHEVQLVNYLKATNSEIGLILNFGMPSLLVKRKYKKSKPTPNPVNLENPVNPVKTSAPNPVQKAFTLLELLVAIAVLSILVVMMMGLVSSASSLWRQSENRADAYREARAALMVMAGDLGSALSGTTNTNHFLSGAAAGALLAPGSPVFDSNRQAVFFLTSLPATAQDPAGNKSDVCQAGYFIAFDRTAMSTNLPGGLPSLNLYRYFLSSDETFQRLTNNPAGNVFTNNLIPTAGSVELLARNIREFRVTPLMVTNGSPARFTNFTATTNKPLPDAVEITLTAVNQESAKRFTNKTDWINGTNGLTNQQQTFTTRIRLNRP